MAPMSMTPCEVQHQAMPCWQHLRRRACWPFGRSNLVVFVHKQTSGRTYQRQSTGLRAVSPRHEDQPTAPPAVPSTGWLWDRSAADTRQRLRQQNIRPKKALGQNFMLDDEVLARIVEVAGIAPGDRVLEIGPGTGNLTRHLLSAGAVVTAVEKDYALAEQLQADFQEVPALRVVQGDIMRVNLPQLLGEMRDEEGGAGGALHQGSPLDPLPAPSGCGGVGSGDSSSGQEGARSEDGFGGEQGSSKLIKVVANLPYNITKECLLSMLPLGGDISHLYFMLQDEVAVRLTGREPGGADWRVMNLITQYYCDAQYKFQIDRRKYHPAPKVNGAVVDFALRPPQARPAVPAEKQFLQLLRKAFSQRRKVMRNSLQPLYDPVQVSAALSALGLNPDARAQDLTLEDFVHLAWEVQPQHAQQGGRQRMSSGERSSQTPGAVG